LERENKGVGAIEIAALGFSIIGLILHGINFYNTWYIPPRAELSILQTAFSHTLTRDHLQVNMTGMIVNEGVRNTMIKEIGLDYWFSREGSGTLQMTARHSISPSSRYFEKENLAEDESTSFTITGAVSVYNIREYGGIPETFYQFTLTIFHDDGLGLISNTKAILID